MKPTSVQISLRFLCAPASLRQKTSCSNNLCVSGSDYGWDVDVSVSLVSLDHVLIESLL